MRVDTTVVETNVHYPTDSSLLGDGVRVLIRTMKRIGKISGEIGAKLREPRSQREAAGPGHRPGGRAQSQAEPGEAQSILWQLLNATQPSGGTGEAVLQRDRRRNEAREERLAAAGARRPAPRARRNWCPLGQASDEADESAHLRGDNPRRQASSSCVFEAVDGDHSQR